MTAIRIDGYARHKYQTPDGKTKVSRDKDDTVARLLRGQSVDFLARLMEENGLGERLSALMAQHEEGKVNIGQVRMLAGQALRRKLFSEGLTSDGAAVELTEDDRRESERRQSEEAEREVEAKRRKAATKRPADDKAFDEQAA